MSAEDVRAAALELARLCPEQAGSLHRIANHPALRLPPVPAEPAPGDVLDVRGRRYRVLAAVPYPDGLRLTLADDEATTTHRCPPDGSVLMPCCGQTPFEVPRTDRLTEAVGLVTCDGEHTDEPEPAAPEPVEDEREVVDLMAALEASLAAAKRGREEHTDE